MLPIIVAGATGRMGQMVRVAVKASDHAEVVALLEYAQHPRVGAIEQPENLPLLPDLAAVDLCGVGTPVVIDFSLGCVTHAEAAAHLGIPMVIGTTGLDEKAQGRLAEAARRIPILRAPNMSLGAAVLRRLVTEAAARLPAGFDIEILESHHGAKRDSPSGTALALGQAAADGRGLDHERAALYGRPRSGRARNPDSIGYAVLRGGGVVGDHTVFLTSPFEQIQLGHRALSREVFAAGALRAAEWLADKPAGLYGIDDLAGGNLAGGDS